jgi:hypothetical protein
MKTAVYRGDMKHKLKEKLHGDKEIYEKSLRNQKNE